MNTDNVQAMADLVGRTALLTDGSVQRGLAYPVEIKQAYGSLRALVTPVGGKGNGWVSLSALTLVDTTA